MGVTVGDILKSCRSLIHLFNVWHITSYDGRRGGCEFLVLINYE